MQAHRHPSWLCIAAIMWIMIACANEEAKIESRRGNMSFLIKGVHEVDAPEPCWLIEVEVDDPHLDWGQVTQETPGQTRDDWQVAWDERPLDDSNRRWVFFFHYLAFDRPLLTPLGAVAVPPATPRPEHLRNIQYEEP
jgi:hypothetical protein